MNQTCHESVLPYLYLWSVWSELCSCRPRADWALLLLRAGRFVVWIEDWRYDCKPTTM